MAITVDASSDVRWIRVVIPDSTHPEQPNTTIAIDREALDEIFQEDPRPTWSSDSPKRDLTGDRRISPTCPTGNGTLANKRTEYTAPFGWLFFGVKTRDHVISATPVQYCRV